MPKGGMTLKQRQSQRQVQALAMTPELQQAIRLLQMSNMELQAFVAQELERNPLLELREDEPEERRAANREDATRPDAAAPGTLPNDGESGQESLTEAFAEPAPSQARLDAVDADPADMFDATAPSDQPAAPTAPAAAMSLEPGMSGGAAGMGAGSSTVAHASGELSDLEATLAGTKSLREHLQEQMELAMSDPAQRLIAQQLIARLDSDGYLREPLAAIAEELGADEAEVERVLRVLQTLEPAGVFARDLTECFRLQLAEQGELDRPMSLLLQHLDLLAARDFVRLARLCGVAREDLPALMERLKRLDPRPGAAFGDEPVQVVVPDVFVRAAPQGGWLVELNTETLPRVLVNNQYRALVNAPAVAEKDRQFVHECATRANWLVRALQQRARTILAVAEEVVRRQDAFFLRGVAGLKPLTLRQVADMLGMHESTVSRVVANKYMATPRGIFEFRYFFTTAIASTDGEQELSAEAVRHRIRQLIDNETPDKVLSDDALVKLLRAEGINIARRTVAKYRESMGIPSSPARRREKRLLLKTGD